MLFTFGLERNEKNAMYLCFSSYSITVLLKIVISMAIHPDPQTSKLQVIIETSSQTLRVR